MSLRERMLQADDLQKEIVDLSDIKGYEGVKVEVRTMTGEERGKVLDGTVSPDGQVDFSLMYPKYVVYSTYDPETGTRLFTEEDIKPLARKSGAMSEKIAKVAMKLSGLAPESFDKAVKNSETTQSEDSISN